MQARYYDPVIGRFYSDDPIGFRDVHSFNRYAYANNNPYKYVDPTGMVPGASSQRTECSYAGSDCGATVGKSDGNKDEKNNGDEKNNKSAFNNYVKNSVDGLTSISLGEVWDKLSGLNPAVGGSLVGLKYLAILPKLSGELRIANGVIHSPNGFKMNLRYYDRLWKQGRPAPFIQAAQMMKSNPNISPDPRGMTGFNKYVANGLEMLMNPQTKEIWHIQPIRVKK